MHPNKKRNVINYNIKFGFPYTCSKIFFLVRIVFGVLFRLNKCRYLFVFKILDSIRIKLDFCIFVDWIRLLFFRVLCIIVSCVLKFSCIYMEKDPFNYRFTWLVLRFVLSMTCLIFIPHFFFLLIGWDGLGITRFLLVIYYTRDSSWAAGMKTYLINRIGDGFFIVGLVLFIYKGHWDIKSINDKWILGWVIVLGCFTKRAQFPFSRWLPAAMAAPTPVSSLVHSSTLVTAGIYLMIRFSNIFSHGVFIIIGIRGLWTLYSASLAACAEFDGKKIVAYSTLRQLGLMAVTLSLNLPIFAFFHLITHAMFKALIFICVGYLIKKMGHFQDLRRLKGIWSTRPLLSITLIVRNLSLMGFPFLAGFFSKELILENQILIVRNLFKYLVLLSLPLTSYYRCRLTFNILKGVKYKRISCKDDSNVLLFSILPLYIGCLFVGVVISPRIPRFRGIVSACHLSKIMTLIFILLGILTRWRDIKINKNRFIWFCRTIGYLTPFNRRFWKKNFANLGRDCYYLLDQGGLNRVITKMDERLTHQGRRLVRSIRYFSFPRVGYYILNIFGLRVMIKYML